MESIVFSLVLEFCKKGTFYMNPTRRGFFSEPFRTTIDEGEITIETGDTYATISYRQKDTLVAKFALENFNEKWTISCYHLKTGNELNEVLCKFPFTIKSLEIFSQKMDWSIIRALPHLETLQIGAFTTFEGLCNSLLVHNSVYWLKIPGFEMKKLEPYLKSTQN